MSKDNITSIGTPVFAEIDGLSIRYIQAGKPGGIPVLLTSPWPESIFSFHRVLPALAEAHSIIAADLPGFGHSQSRPSVMAPEAMGDFIIKLLSYFGVDRVHVVAPDVGTPAVLFAALKKPDLFESAIIGGAAARADFAAGALNDAIHSPAGAMAEVDGADAMKGYLDYAGQLTPADIIDDFRAASRGRRFEDAVQYVRGYLTDLPNLEPQLSRIDTPILILAGKSDPIVPPANGQLLADLLPKNRYLLLDAQHRIWEEAVTEYNNELVSWLGGGYRSL
jgi:pimeloyl-ACP methyl ester carboxylesterase